MKVPFKQTTRTGCGSFALANLFNDERFIQDIPDTQEVIAMLNRKMAMYKPDFFIETTYLTSQYFVTDCRLMGTQLFEVEGLDKYATAIAFMPMLVTFVQPNKQLHMVAAALNFQNGLLYMLDSAKEEVIVMTDKSLIAQYHVVGVDFICPWDSPDPTAAALWSKKSFPHIFTEGE